jgi:putative SOS response-associated peptidase YedK
LINARSEPANPHSERHSKLAADGFYEWKRTGKVKQPFHFGMGDDSLFAFAGLWDRWKGSAGEVVESCSILTTTPNALLADVHDRMPVILRPDNYDSWLDHDLTRGDAVTELLTPFYAALMRRYPVSTHINFVKNDDPDCATPLLAGDARSAN